MRLISRAGVMAILLVRVATATAQTPTATENVASSSTTNTAAGISAANPWLGAQVAYKFGGSSDFADNLLVSARLLYEIDLNSSTFHLPVMGNIADLTANVDTTASSADQLKQKAQDLVLSSTGARVGLYPYYRAYKSDVFSLVIHGEGAWKLNAIKDSTDTLQYLQQFRLSGGVEIGLGKTDGDRLPATVSITPAVTLFSSADYAKVFGESKSSFGSFEITGIVPIAQGVGFLLEGIVGNNANTVRAGLVLAVAKKSGS